MELTKTQKISLKVIMLFTIAILSTFLGDFLHDFLGDWKCSGSGQRVIDTYHYEKCNYAEVGFHDAKWHWGYRHWLYFCMCISLFIIQVIDIISNFDNAK